MGQGLYCVDRSDWASREAEPELLKRPPQLQEVFFDCFETEAELGEGGKPAASVKAPQDAGGDGALWSTNGNSTDATHDAPEEPCAASGSGEDQLPVFLSSPAPGDVELTPEEEKRYEELCCRLKEKPEPEISEYCLEDHRRRLVRFLRGEAWNVEATFKRIHEHALWWKSYGMDNFKEEDELDERGPLFVCGKDTCGRPTLVARPCVHFSKSREESIRVARRCTYTVWRCVQRYSPGVETHTIIYDARGLNPRRNLDLVFVREVVGTFAHFPERVSHIIVINAHWTMAAFWATISTFVHPVTKQRMTFCSSDFGDQLKELVGPDHPYLRYALKVRGLSTWEAANVLLPPSTPFALGRLKALSGEESPVESTASRQSTVASETDIIGQHPAPAEKLV